MSDAESSSLSPAAMPTPRAAAPGRSIGDVGVLDLLFRPRRFYASPPPWLRHPATLPAIALIAGMATAVGRLERMMMRADAGGGPTVASSWPIVWGVLIVSGAVSGMLLWSVGAWWYRVRLRWSGVPGVEPEAARAVYFPALLVRAAPTVLLLLWATARHASYRAYWDAPAGTGDVAMLAFPFWSVWVGYGGVRQRFPVSRGRARLWFFAVPVAVFVVAFGVIGALGALASPSAAP